jgi:hypothetical protein
MNVVWNGDFAVVGCCCFLVPSVVGALDGWIVLLKQEQEQPSSCKTAVWMYDFLRLNEEAYGICMVQCECKCLVYVVLILTEERKETKRSDVVLFCIVPEASLVFVRRVITEK